MFPWMTIPSIVPALQSTHVDVANKLELAARLHLKRSNRAVVGEAGDRYWSFIAKPMPFELPVSCLEPLAWPASCRSERQCPLSRRQRQGSVDALCIAIV